MSLRNRYFFSFFTITQQLNAEDNNLKKVRTFRENARVFRGLAELCRVLRLLHPGPSLPRRQPCVGRHRFPRAQVRVRH